MSENYVVTIAAPGGEIDSQVLSTEQMNKEVSMITETVKNNDGGYPYTMRSADGDMVIIPSQILKNSVIFIKSV